MRMLLRAGFDTLTGYGNDAVDMAMALDRAGVDVVLNPLSMRSGLPRKFTDLLHKEPVGEFDVILGLRVEGPDPGLFSGEDDPARSICGHLVLP